MTLKRRIARLEAASPLRGGEDGPFAALARALPEILREARPLPIGLVRGSSAGFVDVETEDRRDLG